MPIESMRPVIVGVDGSSASMAAVDLAAEEAMGRAVPLLVVHAHNGPPGDQIGALDAARRLVTVAVSRALAEHPSLSVAATTETGQPVDVLVDRSQQASVLVVGHSGRCGSGTPAVESVAHRLSSRAQVPVMVHRTLDTSTPALQQPRPVLLGVACGPGDDPVVEFAFAEASLRGAPLLAVHIWSRSVYGESLATGYGFAKGRDEADRMLIEALMAWSEEYPDVAVHRVVRHGLDIPVALTSASRSAQLAVVGSSRRGRATRPLPSVSHALVHRAGCSVAVVPTD